MKTNARAGERKILPAAPGIARAALCSRFAPISDVSADKDLRNPQLPFQRPAMVAEVVALHQGLRANHPHLRIENGCRREVAMADGSVADIGGVHLPAGLRPKALGDLQLDGPFGFFHNPIGQNVLPEGVLALKWSNPGGQVSPGLLHLSCLLYTSDAADE